MSRKFSIIQSINLNKIHSEIDKYILLNNCFDPYIFMSEKTAKAIENEIGTHDIVIDDIDLPNKRNTKDGVYATYTGYKVFINNDLKFGIVEIR